MAKKLERDIACEAMAKGDGSAVSDGISRRYVEVPGGGDGVDIIDILIHHNSLWKDMSGMKTK